MNQEKTLKPQSIKTTWRQFIHHPSLLMAYFRGLQGQFGSQVFTFFLNLWILSVCVKTLGSLYGLWAAGFALVSLVGALELGMGLFLIREVAQLRTKQVSTSEWQKLHSTLFWSYSVAGILIVFIGYWLSPSIVRFLHIQPEHSALMITVFRLAALYVGMEQVLGLWRCFVQGSQKLGSLGLLTIFETVVLALLVTFGLAIYPSILMIPIFFLIATSLRSFLSFLWIPREIRNSFWPLTLPDRDILKNMFRYCKPMWVAKACYLVKERMDEPMIAYFLGGNAVLIYMATLKLIRSVPLSMIDQFTAMAFSTLSEALARGSHDKIKSIVLRYLKWAILFSMICGLVIVAINPVFIRYWLGPQYFGGHALTVIFCTWIFLEVLTRPFGIILYAAGKINILAKAQFVEAISNLVLSLIMIRYFNLRGVAAGTALAALLSTTWMVPWFVFKYLNIQLKEVLQEINPLFFMQLGAVAFIGALSIWSYSLEQGLLISISSWTFFCLALYFIFGRELKQITQALFQRYLITKT